MELTRSQRKALRRLSRGQSIPRSAYHDPLIQKCIDQTHYITPPDITTGVAYDLTPTEAKQLAYALLAAAHWAEQEPS